MTEDTRTQLASTILTIARQYLDRCCSEPLSEHLAHEVATIAIDTTLPEHIRNEAHALLHEAAQ